MFFGSRKRHRPAGGASRPSDPFTNEDAKRLSCQLDTWRRAAQTVAHAWKEWSAADGRDRAELYRRYTSALAEEERAADQLERTIDIAGQARDARSVCGRGNSRHWSAPPAGPEWRRAWKRLAKRAPTPA